MPQRNLVTPRFTFFSVSVVLLLGFVLYTTASHSEEAAPKATTTPGAKAAARSSAGPQYTEKGDLKLPADFQTWVFVGSNLGLEYRDTNAEAPPPKKDPAKPAKVGNFHNIYINPEAYDVYAKTGKFPDKTMLMLDVYKADEGEPKSVVAEGRFPGKQIGIAAAVKNSARPDGKKTEWAYYDFPLGEKTASAFPDKACYDCHIEHADDDCVWVQFYPTLRKARAEREQRAKGAAK